MSRKSRHVLLMILVLAVSLLLPISVSAQARSTAHPVTSVPSEKTTKADASKVKRAKSAVTTGQTRPLILAQPGNAGSSQGKETSAKKTTQAPTPLSGECGWTLLLLNEYHGWYLEYWGVSCLGCRISTNLSQSTPGILGYSTSPNGPWTETLTIYTDIDFSGHGLSEVYYTKGLAIGTTTFHTQDAWTPPIDIEFQVHNCSCPSIPVVP